MGVRAVIGILLASFSLVGGTVKDVPGADFLVASNGLSSTKADEDHTPGADPWYAEVSLLKVPSDWQVWTNGFTCTNDDWKPQVEHRGDFGDLDLALTFGGHADDIPLRENQFDVGWSKNGVRYYALAHGSETRSCASLYGHTLWQMRAHRPDVKLRAGLASSFCAYWERVRKGCESSSGYYWDLEWGPTDPDSEWFRYDLENSYGVIDGIATYLTPSNYVPGVRLLEHLNVTNLIRHVDRMRRGGLTVTINPGDEISDHMGNTAFLYRQHWLTDPNELVGDASAFLAWATTALPPFFDQELSKNSTYTPVKQDFKLIPTFGWRKNSIAREIDGVWVLQQHWQCCAVTLDCMLNGAAATHPLRRLYDMVGHDQSAGPLEMVKSYRLPDPLHDMMSNTFSRCMRSLPSGARSADAYDDQSWDYKAYSRKLAPGQMVGVNQVLGLMDKTIAIPSMEIDATCRNFFNRTSAEYTSEEGALVEVHYSGGRVTLLEDAVVTIQRDAGSSSREQVGSSFEDNRLTTYVSAISDSVSTRGNPVGYMAVFATIDEDFVKQMFEDTDGHPFEIIEVSAHSDGDQHWFTIHFKDIETGDRYERNMVPEEIAGEHSYLMLTPGLEIKRSWRTTETEQAYSKVGARPSGDELDTGYLARRDLKDEGELTVSFKASSTGNRPFDSAMDEACSSLLEEQHWHAKDLHPGFDSPSPDEGIGEIPKRTYATALNGGEFDSVVYDVSTEYPITVDYYEAWFMTEGEYETRKDLEQIINICECTNSIYEKTAFATIVSNVYEEGWSEVIGSTNVTRSVFKDGSYALTTNEHEAVVTYAETNVLRSTFAECQMDKTNLLWIIDIQTNKYISTFHTNTVTDLILMTTTNIVCYYTNFVVAAAETNVTESSFELESIESHSEYDSLTDASRVEIGLTGHDILGRDEYTVEHHSEEVVLHNVYYPGPVCLQFFNEPHTGEWLPYGETYVDTLIGTINISVYDPPQQSLFSIELEDTMPFEYNNIINLRGIMSKQLELESMTLKENK